MPRKKIPWSHMAWSFLLIASGFAASLLVQLKHDSQWYLVPLPLMALAGWKVIQPRIRYMNQITTSGYPLGGAIFSRAIPRTEALENQLSTWAAERQFHPHRTSSASRPVFMKSRRGMSPVFVALTLGEPCVLESWIQSGPQAAPIDGKTRPVIPQRAAAAELNALLALIQEPPVGEGDRRVVMVPRTVRG